MINFFEKLQNILFRIGLRKGYEIILNDDICKVQNEFPPYCIWHHQRELKRIMRPDVEDFLKENKIKWKWAIFHPMPYKFYVPFYSIVLSRKEDAALFLLMIGGEVPNGNKWK